MKHWHWTKIDKLKLVRIHYKGAICEKLEVGMVKGKAFKVVLVKAFKIIGDVE